MTEPKIEKFQTRISIADQLKLIQNAQQTITVSLKNGISLSGKIEAVDSGKLVLTQLVGKEFFDAMIAIDDIVTLEVRVKYA